ncbi:MAG TPA: SPFH domain-containing protein [Haliangiales bacterium]|nr:SPFH domain-containing protein [Haliangiales bacterium]
MGIIDFVKGGIREMAVARPDPFKGLVVYKHPDTTIPKKAQVTVEADEVALFFRDGKLVGQLAPGRHSVETDNIPFINQLIDWGTGGNLWIAEIYFVTTRELVGTKFGGKIGKIRDPQSGLPVELMVNGTFSFKVIDPPRLVIGLVGLQRTNNEEFLAWFKELVLKVIKDDIAELCVKKKWPLLDVTSGAYTEEICTEVVNGLHEHTERYGIEVTTIGNFNLAMKDDDEQRLNKLYETSAYVNMAGGIQGYQQVAAAQAMMKAGEGMAKGGEGAGGLLAGAGLGVGMAMANQMQNAMAHPPAQAAGIPGAAPAMNTVTCPSCKKTVAAGKFCPECGGSLAAAGAKFCTGCGQKLNPGAKFCGECGTAAPG